MAIEGLTKRWIINSLWLIFGMFLILMLCVLFAVRSYYYSGLYQTIKGHASGAIGYFANSIDSGSDFDSTAVFYVENFRYKQQMEVMAFNNSDEIIITSTGFAPDNKEIMPDYIQSKSCEDNYFSWTGKLSSGEKVMAVTQTISDLSGNDIGSIRYVVSLDAVDKQVMITTLIFLSIAVVIVIFVLISSTLFIKSIIDPVNEICITANKIAQGDFNSRIEKRYDDEIGNLCDTVNYMASELANSEKMKNDFISSVSHELRTPLTAIKGWAETMKLSGPSDAQTMDKGLGIIIKESERLSGIVEELLDFSRMQNKSMVLMLGKVDLLAELDEVFYIYRERAIKEEKHLVFDAPEFLPPVLGDKNRLKQVFVNVIDNALKYTEKNGMVNINTQLDKDMIYIMISDNGCGIPIEHLPRIKDKFYKVNTTKRGSGIGLAVADEIMSLHSGGLRVDSEEGIGTTVTISIPILKEDEDSN